MSMKLSAAIALSLASPPRHAPRRPAAPSTQRVVLAGGCFWGMQLVFESLRGVDRVVAGYSGGNADYRAVRDGQHRHDRARRVGRNHLRSREDLVQAAARRLFPRRARSDRAQSSRSRRGLAIPLGDLLHVGRSSAPRRSPTSRTLSANRVYSSKIVTIVAPLRGFYPAEAYHQDFAVHNPQNPYIVFNDLPKLKKLRQEYPALVKANAPFRDSVPRAARSRRSPRRSADRNTSPATTAGNVMSLKS